MSVGKLCIKLFDFECKNILNPETVSKVTPSDETHRGVKIVV